MTKTEQFWEGRTFLHWLTSMWCNYKCWYCRQDHARSAGHWADAAEPSKWYEALEHHFSGTKLSINMTGGETMMHKGAVSWLLQKLEAAPWVDSIRLDTNGSWNPYSWPEPGPKVALMVSYHPTEVTERDFFRNLDNILNCNWKVLVVNLVMLPERLPTMERIHRALKARGIAFGAIPAYGSMQYYTPEQQKLLAEYMSPVDFRFRSGGSTRGQSCLYPHVAYEMNPLGVLEVACHPHLVGSIWDEKLPVRQSSYVPCPYDKCQCTDRYTFLQELDCNTIAMPLEGFASRTLELPLI